MLERRGVLFVVGLCWLTAVTGRSVAAAPGPGGQLKVVHSEFLYDKASFPSCHASTIAETKEGLVAAWFGGSDEGMPDVGIWVARRGPEGWSKPVEVVNGRQPNGKSYPCWNPVLASMPDGRLVLYYKVGATVPVWWGMQTTSTDGGKTWGTPERLPEGILGPIKNKLIILKDGTLLSPSSTEDKGYQVHIERSRDGGATWTRTPSLNDGKKDSLIQPTILTYADGKLQFLCRSEQGWIYESWSTDQGVTWTPPKPTKLPNPDSGIDAVTLKDGRALLIYNDTPKARSPLNVATSHDGKEWTPGPILEDQPGEYSYPAVIQTSDGLVHVTYTWKRQRIKHVVIDLGETK